MDSTKVCKDCGLDVPLDDFPKHKQMGDGHLNFCRTCVAVKQHEIRQRRGHLYNAQRRARYPEIRDEHLAKSHERYTHDEKYRQREQNRARRRYYQNYQRSLEERADYRATHKDEMRLYQLKRYEDRRFWFLQQKEGRCCIQCGESHPACLDWHHRDPATKLFNVSEANSNGLWSIPEALAEMEKCDLICANCHRKMHFEERWAGRLKQAALPLTI